MHALLRNAFLGLDPYYPDPVQRLTSADQDLDDLQVDRDLSDRWELKKKRPLRLGRQRSQPLLDLVPFDVAVGFSLQPPV